MLPSYNSINFELLVVDNYFLRYGKWFKYYVHHCLGLYKMAISGKLGSPRCSISSILSRKYNFSQFYCKKRDEIMFFFQKSTFLKSPISLSTKSRFSIHSGHFIWGFSGQIHRKLNFLYENRGKFPFCPANFEKNAIFIFSDNPVHNILELLRRIR